LITPVIGDFFLDFKKVKKEKKNVGPSFDQGRLNKD
jgi:6-pyruvoyl-tetrahydropterin synthase